MWHSDDQGTAFALLEFLINPRRADMASPMVLEHPFWVFSWAEAWRREVLITNVVLFLAGVLCSAAGIGGGGIYVAVLMVATGLSAHDAVPLSKAVVLSGALATLMLNFRRSLPLSSASRSQEPGASVIDRTAVRIVVPATLLGTFIGVLLNQQCSDICIVILLNVMLYLMVYMVTQKARRKECDSQEVQRLFPPQQLPYSKAGVETTQLTERITLAMETFLGAILLLAVILCGTFHFHTMSCRAERGGDVRMTGACVHPVMGMFGAGFQSWLASGGQLVQFVLVLPLLVCILVSGYSGVLACADASWTVGGVVLYQTVAVVTGLVAGLVGVGGGLILSPFFLLTGMDPAVAVGTSSTCVLFTSCSTALQYMLNDRIISSLAIVFGCTTAIASLVGTSLVHLVQDRSKDARYIITSIVASGVFLSAALSTAKLIWLWLAPSAAASPV